jgi:DNA-binding transcriptional LysR family regulator
MPLIESCGAQKTEHAETEGASGPDWDNVRIFLEVARSKSFRTAAARLGGAGPARRHRGAQLVQPHKEVLFTRHRDGVRLTGDGQKLLTAAEAMEEASLRIIRERGGVTQPFHGEVRMAVTEGLGTFWLTPRLIEFGRMHPKVVIDLHCSMQRPDELILRARADLAIQIEQPVPRDLVVRKVGRMHVIACAARRYLETYGVPKSMEEIADRHRLAMQYADQGRGSESYNRLFPGRSQIGFMALRTDASTAMYAAVLSGLALGWLPTYYFAIGTHVVPLDVGDVISFDIWLSYHPDTGRLARVRRMIDWTIDAFDPLSNPWFRDDFVHPAEFGKFCRGGTRQTIDAHFGRTEGDR